MPLHYESSSEFPQCNERLSPAWCGISAISPAYKSASLQKARDKNSKPTHLRSRCVDHQLNGRAMVLHQMYMFMHKAVCPDGCATAFAQSSHEHEILMAIVIPKKYLDGDFDVEGCDGVCRMQNPVPFLPFRYHIDGILGCQ